MTTHDTLLLPRMAVVCKVMVNYLIIKLLLASGGVSFRESSACVFNTARGGLEEGWSLAVFLFCLR